MRTLKIDKATNDLVIGEQNDLQLVEGPEEEEQALRLILGTNTVEWFLNRFHGLAYEYFQTKQFDEERARIEIVSALGQEPRVEEVLEINFDFDRKNRKLTINFKVVMISGVIQEGEVTI